MGLLRRSMRGQGQEEAGGCPPWDEDSGLGEATWEFLNRTAWEEDNARRETGTVLVFADGSRIKVMLNDRDGAKVAFLTLGPTADLLAAVEAALRSGETDWRAARRTVTGKK